MMDFSDYWNVINYAFEKYNNLRRKISGLPYVIHPIRIALILRAVGYSEFENKKIFIAALLHDLLEDTDTDYDEIKQKFGTIIANIVKELSKPENLNKDDWLKSFNLASKEAKIIKLADRIDNLKDMGNWSSEKKSSYANEAKIILETCGDENKELANILKKYINKYTK